MPNNPNAGELLDLARLSVLLVIEVGFVCIVGFYTRNRLIWWRYMAEVRQIDAVSVGWWAK